MIAPFIVSRCTACNQRRLAEIRCMDVSRIVGMGLVSIEFFDKVLDEVVGLCAEAAKKHPPEEGAN